jgi:Putative prokaryotic signal transducing protein
MKPSDLVIISTFPSAADATIAKGVLDDAEIESMIRTDDAGGMYPAIGGADLLVRAEDRDKARELLTGRRQTAR